MFNGGGFNILAAVGIIFPIQVTHINHYHVFYFISPVVTALSCPDWSLDGAVWPRDLTIPV